MPSKLKKPCAWPMCPALVEGRYCEKHEAQATRQANKSVDERRGTAAERGYDYRWQQAREAFLREHPLCVECEKDNRVTPATVVDHIIPHKGDKVLFWDRTNWQSLCKTHHDRKTATEGAFGRQRRE